MGRRAMEWLGVIGALVPVALSATAVVFKGLRVSSVIRVLREIFAHPREDSRITIDALGESKVSRVPSRKGWLR